MGYYNSLFLIFVLVTTVSCSDLTEPKQGNSVSKVEIVKGSSGIIKKSNKNEYLIHFESDFNDIEKQKYLDNYNIKIISKLTNYKYLVEVNPDIGIEKIKDKIKSSKYVKYIELNVEYKLMK